MCGQKEWLEIKDKKLVLGSPSLIWIETRAECSV